MRYGVVAFGCLSDDWAIHVYKHTHNGFTASRYSLTLTRLTPEVRRRCRILNARPQIPRRTRNRSHSPASRADAAPKAINISFVPIARRTSLVCVPATNKRQAAAAAGDNRGICLRNRRLRSASVYGCTRTQTHTHA